MNDSLRVAAALEVAGHKPAPWVGQQWQDDTVTWLPTGHKSIVTITSLGATVSGWQARVMRRHYNQHGEQTWVGITGVMHVKRLFDDFTPLPSQHLLHIEPDPAGRLLYRLQCSGVGDECRLYRPDICPDDCKPVMETEVAEGEDWWDEDELISAHGVVHRFFDGEWMAGTDTCFYATHPNLADTASELFTDTGQPLGPGCYPVALFMEQGEFLNIGLEEK